jgi:hypothetical protein
MPLSVISALARLEVDPWQEAARLADLPKELAAAALDGLLRRLPAGGWDQAETPSIVARLIALLPRRDVVGRSVGSPSGSANKARPPAMLWLMVAVLGAVILLSVLAHGAQQAADHGASTALTNDVRSAAQP